MNDQIIILLFLIASISFTLFLYLWKAKKEIQYKKDERWQVIQNKANNVANCSNYILIVLLAVGNTLSLFHDIKSISFTRVLIYASFFIGFRNMIEVFALKYYDSQL